MAVKPKITHLTKDIIRESALKELRLRGYDVWRQNNIPVRGRKFIGRKGVSDIIGLTKDCRWVACEVKTLNDKLSDDQTKFLNDIKNSGGMAYLAIQQGSHVAVVEWEENL
jgi:hypothetical protein